jgi:surface protein
MACICRLSAMAAHSALLSVKRLSVGLASMVQTAISTQAHLINRAAFSLGLIILMLSSAQANASCTVNGVSYRTNGAASGTYITLVDLTNRASTWNNSTDLVTTCDVSRFTSMSRAFLYNTTFDQDLSAWDTSAVIDMAYMFTGATSLTSVSLPKTGAVTNMFMMLRDTTSLTTVSLPDTSAVTDMRYMFNSSSAFNQDIRGWDVTSVTSFGGMFMNATAMISNFGSTPNWNVTPTSAWFVVPDTNAPTISSVSLNTAQDALTVTFSESVYDTTGGSGDLEAADFALSIAGGTATLGSATPTSITKTSQLVWVLGFSTTGTFDGAETITLVPASSTSIYDAAANAAATSQSNNTANFNASGSPASEFANHKATIKNVITGEVSRALRSSIASDQRMVRKSLTRSIADQSGSDANQDVAFFVDGNAELKVTQADLVVSTQGDFLSQKTTGDGTWRKLAFGDFDVQTDDDKNVSGFLNGRMAFETNLNSTTMFGYFVGGQLGRSILKGTFEGSQNSFGASFGGYLVQTLAKDVYADLFASLGTNRNSLKLSNGTLDLDSSYSTTSSNIGGSVTGVYAMESFEVWPTLAVTHGVTNVGDVGFTGIAYSLTDTTLSLDAGKVSLTSLSFTPEVRMPFQLQEGSSSMATFAPRYTCEQTGNSSSRECGSGAALGVTTASEDGLTNLNAQFQYDKVGSTALRSLQLGFERKF